jgi:putative salt-induced outer membrane protein YdiY
MVTNSNDKLAWIVRWLLVWRQIASLFSMKPRIQRQRLTRVFLVLCFGGNTLAQADVLIGLNGERFVGKVIEEKADTIVFESETGGRITIARSRIRELQRTSQIPAPQTNQISVVPTNQISATQSNQMSSASLFTVTNAAWQPPTLGKDGFDWIQLKSGEWLKGHLNYVQDKNVQFESDELEDLSLKLKDIWRLHSAKPLYTKFDGREQVYGTVSISNKVVEVIGPEQLTLSRDLLQGITPGGSREIEFWSGKANIGLNFQSGNTKQATLNASGELARRTPATQFLLNYLGNFSEVEGTQNANNHRINGSYDVRLNRDWFLRPVQVEYYRDQLANIAHRGTIAVGVGYYIFDRDDLEWKIAAGPGYQYTRFETVAANEEDNASTPAGTLQTRFKWDITPRLTWIESFSGILTSEQAGLYNHHVVSTLEFEIKRYLDLDLSFVWDYLQSPQIEANGTVPQHSDLRLTLSIGAKF